MKRNSRISIALHVLLHMADQRDRPMTSENLAVCAGTNPVVIRRTFAGLREAGIVSSSKGHGGGWLLARAPAQISLAHIQAALDEQVVTLAKAQESRGCLVEQAVNRALDEVMAETERLLSAQLEKITLADLARDVGRLPAHEGNRPHAA